MVASTCVLPQEPFPVASLDHSHKRHNSLSSLHDWDLNNSSTRNSTRIKIQNTMANYKSLSSSSISSSSRHSPKSVASITPSMSPSSIISSQRANRQEKKHHTIHSSGVPPGKGINRSALVYTSSQPEPPSPSSPSSQSRSGAQGTPKSLKRFSVWASSVRQALSSSSSSHPIHGSCKSTTTPPQSLRQKSTGSITKSEHSNQQKFSNLNKHTPEGTEPLTNVISAKSTATSSSASSSPPLLYSFSFEPRGSRLSQGTRRKIGAGLITAFCIAAIVLLVLC